MSSADLEQAVLALFNPQTPANVKAQAAEYFDQLKASDEGWKLFTQKLFETSNIKVAIVCLNVLRDVLLHRYLTLNPADQTQLKRALVTYAQQYVGPTTPREIVNAIAVVIVLIFKNEFPERWPTFFADLGSALLVPRASPDGAASNGGNLDIHLVEMYLAILREIDTEVVSREVHRSNEDLAHNRQLKDHMRDSGSVAHLVDVCYNLLQQYHTTHAGISKNCLSVLRPYIDWIDIRLIVNERVFPLFLQLLRDPNVQAESLGCILEVASKGMDPLPKINLLKHIDIVSIINYFQPSSEPAACVFAEFINVIGVEVISAMLAMTPEMEPVQYDMSLILEAAVKQMLQLLRNDLDDVAERVEEFAGKYVHYLELTRKRRNPNILVEQMANIAALLQVLRQKMKYDSGFNFHNKGQDETDFIDFRKKLDNIFKSLTKLHPELVAEFVSSLVASIDMMNDPLEMESAVHTFNLLGEGMPITGGNNAAFFADLLNRLALSKIFNFQQPPELCGEFFDCAYRYGSCIVSRTDLFPRLLQLFISDRGVMHPDPRARAQRCWWFCGFVKKLKQALQPFLGDLVERLKPAVAYNTPVFRRDEEGNTDVVDSVTELTIDMQNNLFESLGLLVGVSSGDAPDKHRNFLQLLVTPLIEKIVYILDNQLYKQDSLYQPVNTTWLCNLISAAGTFSKGFAANLKNQSTFYVEYYASTVPIVLRAFSEVGSNELVRSRVISYMHRMIPCLGAGQMIPHFARLVELLLSNANVKSTLEVVTLINTAVISFNEQLAATMDQNGLMISVLKYVMAVATSAAAGSTAGSEDAREAYELRRAWYNLVGTIASNKLVHVFASPNSVAHLNDILQALIEGANSFADPSVVTASATTLVRMVEAFTRPAEQGGLAGFDKFVYTQLMKALLEALMNPQYKLDDAKFGVEAMGEFGQIFKELHKNRGAECEQFVQMALLPALGCPEPVAMEFVQQLRQCPDKQFGPILKKFVESRR